MNEEAQSTRRTHGLQIEEAFLLLEQEIRRLERTVAEIVAGLEPEPILKVHTAELPHPIKVRHTGLLLEELPGQLEELTHKVQEAVSAIRESLI